MLAAPTSLWMVAMAAVAPEEAVAMLAVPRPTEAHVLEEVVLIVLSTNSFQTRF